jgi:hypothetical protein
VPGDHSSMFQEPHVRTLAQQLNGCLDQLHADGTVPNGFHQ